MRRVIFDNPPEVRLNITFSYLQQPYTSVNRLIFALKPKHVSTKPITAFGNISFNFPLLIPRWSLTRLSGGVGLLPVIRAHPHTSDLSLWGAGSLHTQYPSCLSKALKLLMQRLNVRLLHHNTLQSIHKLRTRLLSVFRSCSVHCSTSGIQSI